MSRNSTGSVELRDLTDSRELRDLTAQFIVSATSPVLDLALVTDIEEIASVGPDTVILLSQNAALGGWMISSALRYAWERRACALIVPEPSLTETVIDLAKRLGMSLLTTNRDMTRLALDVAIQIGVARAGSVARIQALTDRVSHAPDLVAVVSLISRELGGALVRIVSSGSVTIAAAGDPPEARRQGTSESDLPVSVEVSLARSGKGADTVNAEVTAHLRPFAEQALFAAAPSIRALLSDSKLQATRASLPLVTIAALTSSREFNAIDEPALPANAGALHWPLSGAYLAVCILTDDRDRVGGAVHQVWNDGFPDVPLARFSDGWLAFVPVRDEKKRVAVISELRERLEQVRGLELMVGVSALQSGQEGAADSARKAWLAARLAEAGDPDSDSLVEFDTMPAHLLSRVLPRDLAEQLASGLFPRLMADPAADELIESLVAYLSARGSISLAAQALGLHRNTIQARVRRAEELGLHLGPQEVLPTHMLLTALARRSKASTRR